MPLFSAGDFDPQSR